MVCRQILLVLLALFHASSHEAINFPDTKSAVEKGVEWTYQTKTAVDSLVNATENFFEESHKSDAKLVTAVKNLNNRLNELDNKIQHNLVEINSTVQFLDVSTGISLETSKESFSTLQNDLVKIQNSCNAMDSKQNKFFEEMDTKIQNNLENVTATANNLEKTVTSSSETCQQNFVALTTDVDKILIRLDEMDTKEMKRISEMDLKLMKHLHELETKILDHTDKKDDAVQTRMAEINNVVKSIEVTTTNTSEICQHNDKVMAEDTDKVLNRLDEKNKEILNHFGILSKNVEWLSLNNTNTTEVKRLEELLKRVNDLDTKFINHLDEIKDLVKSLDVASRSSSGKSEKKEKEFILFTNETKNWFEAFEDCRVKGMSLASIESEDEYQTVLKKIEAVVSGQKSIQKDFWLSGTDFGHEGRFVWLSTGRNMTYSKWHQVSPDLQPNHRVLNNETQHCVEMNQKRNYEWSDSWCSFSQYYICQY